MGDKEHHIDLSAFGRADNATPSGKEGVLARFAGRVVSFANLLPPREARRSAISCRRRPNRRPCVGRLEVERDAPAGRVRWRCPVCRDSGTITGWGGTRWDLTPQLQSGDVVSLFQAQAQRGRKVSPGQRLKVLELDVELIGGPVSLDRRVARRMRISSDRTLHDLHQLIRSAFNWKEDEPYDFMFGAPYETGAQRFTGGVDPAGCDAESELGETELITLETLDLAEGQIFGYLFDFGEEWVHRVTVKEVSDVVGYSVEPRVLRRDGEAPPQHPDTDPWDDDLLWAELEDEYPMTGLYGPYVADETPDAETWCSMEELERLLLVIEAHAQHTTPDHPPIDAIALHAVVHCLAETQIAKGDRPARARLSAAMRAGKSRHHAIHEMGELIVRGMLRSPVAPSRLPKKAKTSRRKSRGGTGDL